MFNSVRRLGTSIGIRFNSTVIPVEVKSTIPPKVKVFPSLAEISADTVFGSKPFGGPSLAYFVGRTRFGHLPVYKTVKQKVPYTEIRRINGNAIQLRADLIEALPKIPKKDFKYVQQSKKIIVRGDYANTIKQILASKF